MERYNKYRTKQYIHTHWTHLSWCVSTRLGDHQWRPYVPLSRWWYMTYKMYVLYCMPLIPVEVTSGVLHCICKQNSYALTKYHAIKLNLHEACWHVKDHTKYWGNHPAYMINISIRNPLAIMQHQSGLFISYYVILKFYDFVSPRRLQCCKIELWLWQNVSFSFQSRHSYVFQSGNIKLDESLSRDCADDAETFCKNVSPGKSQVGLVTWCCCHYCKWYWW